MTSRDNILRAIRRQLPQATPLPDRSGSWIQYDNPLVQFAQVLASVGGECHHVPDVAAIPQYLQQHLVSGNRVVSGIPGLREPNFDFNSFHPDDMADVELAVLPGVLAVAENAAVWVETDFPAQRAACFLSQHLALVVPASGVVHNLHEAYERLQVGTTRFSCWISGPSKTADIEQSLVKGAHGARTLQVFLVES